MHQLHSPCTGAHTSPSPLSSRPCSLCFEVLHSLTCTQGCPPGLYFHVPEHFLSYFLICQGRQRPSLHCPLVVSLSILPTVPGMLVLQAGHSVFPAFPCHAWGSPCPSLSSLYIILASSIGRCFRYAVDTAFASGWRFRNNKRNAHNTFSAGVPWVPWVHICPFGCSSPSDILYPFV
jgi:hypothetical protein